MRQRLAIPDRVLLRRIGKCFQAAGTIDIDYTALGIGGDTRLVKLVGFLVEADGLQMSDSVPQPIDDGRDADKALDALFRWQSNNGVEKSRRRSIELHIRLQAAFQLADLRRHEPWQ